MTTLTITRGLPGSGKTHWARGWVAEDPVGRARVNRDDLRNMLHSGAFRFPDRETGSAGTEPPVRDARTALIRTLLSKGIDVVCDDTNLPQHTARHLRDLAHQTGATFAVHDLRDVPLEVCLERNAARTGRACVPPDKIRALHAKYIAAGPLHVDEKQPPAPAGGEPYVPKPGLQTAYIVDVDGTVALMSDRSPYDATRVHEDRPNEPVIKLVRTLYEAGHSIVFCSGRKEAAMEATARWLDEHVRVTAALFMRRDDDNRKDATVKLEIFDRHIRNQYAVLGVIDDRRQVVDAWRSIGLTVFQVAPGDF